MRKLIQFAGIAAVAAILFVFSQMSPAHAATVKKSFVGCSVTVAKGRIETPAPYVRATVTLASDLTQQLDAKVVRVGRDGSYKIALKYPAQAKGTRLIVAIGEWDGTQYVQPANIFGADCGQRP